MATNPNSQTRWGLRGLVVVVKPPVWLKVVVVVVVVAVVAAAVAVAGAGAGAGSGGGRLF